MTATRRHFVQAMGSAALLGAFAWLMASAQKLQIDFAAES